MSASAVARRVSSLYRSRFLRGYVSAKISADPLYDAVFSRLEGSALPLLDLGCGAGVLSFYLRERGFRPEILGIDHDERKVDAARAIASASYPGLRFECADVRRPEPFAGSVTLLDVLHYFPTAEQQAILEAVADRVAPGGMAILRDAIRDSSWRYRATYVEETLARAIRWLRTGALNFPEAETVLGPFRERGFTIEVTPLWGRTPYNNYLFAFRRPPAS